MLKIKSLYIFWIVTLIHYIDAGYGDWTVDYNGFPDMKDRQILVLTNSCRIDPTRYRDLYLGNYDILLPQNYPPVDPLYWQIDLNRVARIHSEDQAINGMSHTSSDGTSFGDRVKFYYTKSGWIAENIAAGSSKAKATIKQWLMDYIDYQTMTPAEDNSANDGHRKNIMSANYNEMGAGYAYGPAKYNHFWTQDFGGGTTNFNNPISSAAHFIENGKSVFMFTVKDPAGNKIQDASLVLEDENYDLDILFGDSIIGTFSQSLESSDSCRDYFINIIDSEGNSWRYPEDGKLITIGEGDCEDQYKYPEDISIINNSFIKFSNEFIEIIRLSNNEIIFKLKTKNDYNLSTSIYSISGKRVISNSIQKVNNGSYLINTSSLSKGFYIVNVLKNNVLCAKIRYLNY